MPMAEYGVLFENLKVSFDNSPNVKLSGWFTSPRELNVGQCCLKIGQGSKIVRKINVSISLTLILFHH